MKKSVKKLKFLANCSTFPRKRNYFWLVENLEILHGSLVKTHSFVTPMCWQHYTSTTPTGYLLPIIPKIFIIMLFIKLISKIPGYNETPVPYILANTLWIHVKDYQHKLYTQAQIQFFFWPDSMKVNGASIPHDALDHQLVYTLSNKKHFIVKMKASQKKRTSNYHEPPPDEYKYEIMDISFIPFTWCFIQQNEPYRIHTEFFKSWYTIRNGFEPARQHNHLANISRRNGGKFLSSNNWIKTNNLKTTGPYMKIWEAIYKKTYARYPS
jgi:hypothetical protein